MERKIINKNDIQAFYKKAVKSGNEKDEVYLYLFDETSDISKKSDYIYLLKTRFENKNKYMGYIFVENICVFGKEEEKDSNVNSNFNTLTGKIYDYLLEHKLIKIPFETQKSMQLETLVDDLNLHGLFKDFLKIDEENDRLIYSEERSAVLKSEKTSEFENEIKKQFNQNEIKKIQKLAGEFNKSPSSSTREAIAIAKLVLKYTQEEYLGESYQTYLKNKEFYWNYILIVLVKEKEMFTDLKRRYSGLDKSFSWESEVKPKLDKFGFPKKDENGKVETYQSLTRTFNSHKFDPIEFDWLFDIYLKLGAHLDIISRAFDPEYNTGSGKKEVSFETYIYNEIKKKLTSIRMNSKYTSRSAHLGGITFTKQDENLLYKFGGKLDFVLGEYFNSAGHTTMIPSEKFITDEMNKSIEDAHKKRDAGKSDYITEEQVKQLLTLRNYDMVGFTYCDDEDEEVELRVQDEENTPSKSLERKEDTHFSSKIFNPDSFFKRENLMARIFDENNIKSGIGKNGEYNEKVLVLKDGITMVEKGKKALEEYLSKQRKDEVKTDRIIKILGEINNAKTKSISLQNLLELKGKRLKEFESDESKQEINNLLEQIIEVYNHIGENLLEQDKIRESIFSVYSINPLVFPKNEENPTKFNEYLDDIYNEKMKINLMKALYFIKLVEGFNPWEIELFLLSVIFHNTNLERIKYYLENKYEAEGLVISLSGNQMNRICNQILIKLKHVIKDLFSKK